MPRIGKWDESYILKAYLAAREGYSDIDIARTLSITCPTLAKWMKTKPAFKDAIDQGRNAPDHAQAHLQAVYDRLPDELQDVWDRIEAIEPDLGGTGEVARDARRHRRGIDIEIGKFKLRHKQQLYLYALAACDYSRSEAARKCGFTTSTVSGWRRDKYFAQLESAINESKKDLYESSLVRAIRAGDPSCIIFANKTYNRDRGYSDKITITTEESPGRTIEQLNLTLEERLLLLQRLRESQTAALPDPNVQDAELVEVTNQNGQEPDLS